MWWHTVMHRRGNAYTVRTPDNIAVVRGGIERIHTVVRVATLCRSGCLKPAFNGFYIKIFSSIPTKRSWWHGLMEQHNCNESWTLFEIHAERSQNCHRFCKTLSQQKHVVLQSTAPLQLKCFNPLNPELNPICYLLALLGAHHFLHFSRIRVKLLTFRLLMSYIYIGAPILDVSRSHTTTQHSR